MTEVLRKTSRSLSPLFKRDLRGMFSRVSNILVEELL